MSKKFFLTILVLVAAVLLVIMQVSASTGNNDIEQDNPATQDDLFTPSTICASCHNTLTDAEGTDVSFVTAWQRSTMAQSAIDPYWRASVRKETVANPDELTPTIQDICATCHLSMARTTLNAAGEVALVLDEGGLVNPDHPLNPLALDGVSCLLCHQIQDQHLGEEESFDGGYVIDFTTGEGQRAAFGSFDVAPEMATVMQAASQFVPVQGDHIQKSELCATCHDLITPYLDENDEIAGTFPEQMPYTEWEHSAYNGEKSCQDCHMPDAAGAITISTVSTEQREGVGQHTFVGANLYLPTLLINAGSPIADMLWDNMQLTADFLSTQTAELTVENIAVDEGTLSADVVIVSLTGHKLPTAYPSRRAWIRFVVTDASGTIVFESGGFETNGLIHGNANDLDPDTYEPHYTLINAPDQVQIYEPIMVDTTGVPTTTLLRGSGYAKDNRILPDGFDLETVPDTIAVHGLAAEDADFIAGGDTITYQIALGEAEGPFTVNAILLYQPIGYRWAVDLEQFSNHDGAAQEIDDFLELYDRTANMPRVITSARVIIEQGKHRKPQNQNMLQYGREARSRCFTPFLL